MSEEKHTPTPWSRGRALDTPQTEKWSDNEWADNESEEKRRIFAKFTAQDQGRGRVLICELPYGPDVDANAAFIVKAVNSHDQLVKALRGIHDATFADEAIPDWPTLIRGLTAQALKAAGEEV